MVSGRSAGSARLGFFRYGVKPPAFFGLGFGAGLSFEIDVHDEVPVGSDFVPVFAEVPLAAAVFVGPGFFPDL